MRTLLALVLIAPLGDAQTELYFTEYEFNNPKIKSIGLDGTGLSELFQIPTSDWLPVGIAFDPVTARVYWSDSVSPNTNVFVANIDGTGIQSLIDTTGGSRGPALDGAGKLYFTSGNTLRRANIDGSANELLFTPVQAFPLRAPYVDGTNGHVYIGADGRVLRMNLDGSSVKTVVQGLSTPGAVTVDTANGLVYWIDSDTISDYVGRARLDGDEFTVLVDNSPGVVQSSGLIALLLDRSAQELYVADDLRDDIRRFAADGSNPSPFYASPAGLSPSGMTLSTGEAPQAMLDCNGNGVSDTLDISQGTATDCNDNGVPDDCEAHDPCAPVTFLLDQGSDPVPSSRTVGGPTSNPGSQFEVFQPFDVAGGGWSIGRLGLDGWTANYGNGAGFTATFLPDDGSGTFPDEGAPIDSVVLNFRFDPDTVNWVCADLQLTLGPGRYWLRLTSADMPTYHGAANVGTSGLGSISRSGLGNTFPSGPIALRLVEATCPPPTNHCVATPNSAGAGTIMDWSGSLSVAQNAFVLRAAPAPPTQFGLVYYGPETAMVPFGNGFRCVGAGALQFFRLDPIQVAVSGVATDSPDLTSPTSPLGQITGGSTWSFQFWFRDPQSGGAFFDLSDGLRATFCP